MQVTACTVLFKPAMQLLPERCNSFWKIFLLVHLFWFKRLCERVCCVVH